MQIYLIRHGQTTGDVEDRYGGDYDDRLTDLGKQQSQNLASERSKKFVALNVLSKSLSFKIKS